ncbi:nucleotidyltransferase family protein [Flavihumibacter solisilvae]|uniref:Nucleoside-diphosphate-sugar pyrophosphorylase n=1 Tax=Flavihumibacter solisilvae TaxID=1349421 RepID=A0A0C1IHB0_9BACT|nr:sugar phosphate nucleotidyltransferase [Flavihumibacter solisilvae]KIC93570.1 nucleoside-diphosphate-sugar pyrophosphorylase [Flavihumibacter solisilvae]
MSKRAIILAGGKGTRLKPYTVVLPKPLMPIGDYPILEVIIRQLVMHGFDHITLALNHQADIFRAFFGDGSKWGIRIDYSLERTNLGTIAPLRLVSDLPEHFLVMNGDILSDLDYAAFYREHVEENALFTISSHLREHINLYGVLDVNDLGHLVGFREKPKTTFNVSMGIYMVSREVLGYVPLDVPYGFDNLMLNLIERQKRVRVKAFDGYWLDIGRPDDYMKAIDEFEEKKELFLQTNPILE